MRTWYAAPVVILTAGAQHRLENVKLGRRKKKTKWRKTKLQRSRDTDSPLVVAVALPVGLFFMLLLYCTRYIILKRNGHPNTPVTNDESTWRLLKLADADVINFDLNVSVLLIVFFVLNSWFTKVELKYNCINRGKLQLLQLKLNLIQRRYDTQCVRHLYIMCKIGQW